MKIQDLLDMRKVVELVGDGYLRERAHPRHPSLRILGYTEKAQWEREWTHEARTCRGLIYEAGSGEVLARPWPKFFNHSEHENRSGLGGGDNPLLEPLDLSAPVQVTDKMDGSLGIVFRNPFTMEWEVATRGSFDSDQARLANAELLPPLLGAGWQPADGWTYLAEIIAKENRIVLDYGDLRCLSLLGAVAIETGEVRGPDFDEKWPGRRAEVFPVNTLAEALAMEPRPNAEGLVVRYAVNGVMVKIKQEDYVRLHKIVTGLSDKAVWEHLAAGKRITEMLDAVPDEFHQWVLDTAEGFVNRMVHIKVKASSDFELILDKLGGTVVNRREFAEMAKLNERPHLMFQLFDGRDIDESVWKELRPVGVRYMGEAARGEAVA